MFDVFHAITAIFSGMFYFFDSEKRLYWLFLLCNIAVVALYCRWRQQSINVVFAQLFSRQGLLHRSSQVDCVYLLVNACLWSYLSLFIFNDSLSFILDINDAFYALFGAGDFFRLQHWQLTLLYTCILFLANDFSRFLCHFCYHKIPFLWRFHRVHHSAEVLTPLTLYRIHFVELFINASRSFLILALVTAVFIYLFKGSINEYELFGAALFNFIFNIAGANLRHSSVFMGYGRFEKWFISPAQHQIHHSNQSEHFDKNFGSVLSIWDRLFNCWLASKCQKVKGYGLKS